mgnify:CR=1 FL=1
MLHYMAKRFYAPVILSIFQNNDVIEAWATNDQLQEIEARASLHVLDFFGNLVKEINLSQALTANDA